MCAIVRLSTTVCITIDRLSCRNISPVSRFDVKCAGRQRTTALACTRISSTPNKCHLTRARTDCANEHSYYFLRSEIKSAHCYCQFDAFSQARFLFSDYIARHQQLCCMTCNVVAEMQKKKKTVHSLFPNGVSI